MPKPERQKVHYVLSEDLLPEMVTEHAGSFWIAKAQATVWFCASNGAMVSLSDLLLRGTPIAPPRHGRDGADGAQGPKGETGPAGQAAQCQCKTGLDSVVPGPRGFTGPSIKGDTGDRGPAGPDTRAAIAAANSAVSALRTEFDELKLKIEVIWSQNKQTSDYLEFLRAKRAARLSDEHR
jgi:hypothetical protein